MIPQGTGWQRLRALSLDAVPLGARVFHTRAVPLHEWRRKGAFQVVACDKRQVVLDSAGAEVGTALLADVEYLLDHAAEHRALLHGISKLEAWASPAWTVVTTYYWAFFSALALTRLAGRSVWFLDKPSLSDFRQLAGSKEQPGAGALYFELGEYTTSSNRTLILRPSSKQFHDAVWRSVQVLFAEIIKHCDQVANPMEFRLWLGMQSPGDGLGPSWPSDLRNAVNYRAGYGYREVIHQGEIDLARFLHVRTPARVETLIDELESLGIAVRFLRRADGDVKQVSRLLGWFAILMSGIVEALHAEILDRQKGDPRWSKMRSAFHTERCATSSSQCWPILT